MKLFGKKLIILLAHFWVIYFYYLILTQTSSTVVSILWSQVLPICFFSVSMLFLYLLQYISFIKYWLKTWKSLNKKKKLETSIWHTWRSQMVYFPVWWSRNWFVQSISITMYLSRHCIVSKPDCSAICFTTDVRLFRWMSCKQVTCGESIVGQSQRAPDLRTPPHWKTTRAPQGHKVL